MGRIKVGKPQVKPDTPSHVPGLHEGNKGPYERQVGHHADGTADARRSTGVNWRRHEAILKIMPSIPPG
ncbi:hypothetical protein BJP40_16760 [Streptomyces sp. CC53]|uniref:hypothetical protein n=1 Tax=unclassified Streptomyces TaxID=2593676 RepID=UPI0008DE2408|nr:MULTISPECIES: hypothetical protein [unclassified Streptomyces]OII65452.1 hypothetical protein BJP40_16760 [Streptomyces sp. CC53]OII70325.1 hypothetical protein BJP39_14025 [Streptomyces sp. CC77]